MLFKHFMNCTHDLTQNHCSINHWSRRETRWAAEHFLTKINVAHWVIFGPMFSGKTTELIRRLKRYQIANYQCLIIKYAKDIRYGFDGIATHDRQTLPAMIAQNLSQIDATDYDVIGIDEGQFFTDIVSCCETLANRGKIVIVAALDGTYQRLPFGDILNLVPLAESVIKLSAVCMRCFQDASYTKRTTKENEVEVIGGADKYMSVCRVCHFSNTTTRNSPRKCREEKECYIKEIGL